MAEMDEMVEMDSINQSRHRRLINQAKRLTNLPINYILQIERCLLIFLNIKETTIAITTNNINK